MLVPAPSESLCGDWSRFRLVDALCSAFSSSIFISISLCIMLERSNISKYLCFDREVQQLLLAHIPPSWIPFLQRDDHLLRHWSTMIVIWAYRIRPALRTGMKCLRSRSCSWWACIVFLNIVITSWTYQRIKMSSLRPSHLTATRRAPREKGTDMWGFSTIVRSSQPATIARAMLGPRWEVQGTGALPLGLLKV